jgi:hypothetical protein
MNDLKRHILLIYLGVLIGIALMVVIRFVREVL